MIEVENTDVNIVRNLIPMRNLMPASAYGLKAISDWLLSETLLPNLFNTFHVKFQKSKLPTNLKDLLRQRPLASTIVHQFSPTLSKNSSSSKLFQKLLRR